MNFHFRKITIVFFFAFNLGLVDSSAQSFSGFRALKNMIEFESQRFLLNEVYSVSSENFEQLKIKKIFTDSDESYGFLFVLASYEFNDKNGVVITSFRETWMPPTKNSANQFKNVHLTTKEYIELYNLFVIGYNQIRNSKSKKSLLRRFNERIVLELKNKPNESFKVVLWIDNLHRHEIPELEWDSAYQTHKEGIANKK